MKPLIALLLLSVATACAVESCEPPVYVEAVQEIKVTRPQPACGNVACGVADCDCVDCKCEVLGACLPAPVELTPNIPLTEKEFDQLVDDLKKNTPVALASATGGPAASACRRNADGSWSCGPRQAAAAPVKRYYYYQPQRGGFLRRLFGR